MIGVQGFCKKIERNIDRVSLFVRGIRARIHGWSKSAFLEDFFQDPACETRFQKDDQRFFEMRLGGLGSIPLGCDVERPATRHVPPALFTHLDGQGHRDLDLHQTLPRSNVLLFLPSHNRNDSKINPSETKFQPDGAKSPPPCNHAATIVAVTGGPLDRRRVHIMCRCGLLIASRELQSFPTLTERAALGSGSLRAWRRVQ